MCQREEQVVVGFQRCLTFRDGVYSLALYFNRTIGAKHGGMMCRGAGEDGAYHI